MTDSDDMAKVKAMADSLAEGIVAGFESGQASACEHCPADMELEQDPKYPGVVQIRIFHDDDCPTLLAKTGNRAQRRAAKRQDGDK